MDFFDLSQVIDFAKMEPGHGFVQSVLLFMIWWQGKGLKKELVTLRDGFAAAKSLTDKKFETIELRLSLLEKKGA